MHLCNFRMIRHNCEISLLYHLKNIIIIGELFHRSLYRTSISSIFVFAKFPSNYFLKSDVNLQKCDEFYFSSWGNLTDQVSWSVSRFILKIPETSCCSQNTTKESILLFIYQKHPRGISNFCLWFVWRKNVTSILDKNVCLPSLLWVFHSTGFTAQECVFDNFFPKIDHGSRQVI